MIGIEAVGVHIPKTRISNYGRQEEFNLDSNFIEGKIGIAQISVKDGEEHASDLAVRAYYALCRKVQLDKGKIDCLIVVTQNPDYPLPHTSAIVHGKLNLGLSCASFDLSLGCSGFVYGLSLIESFMERNGLNFGILITSDPYSEIVDRGDKNTCLLFGDAATATLVSRTPKFVSGKFTFGTIGKQYSELICRKGILSMRGRSIFDYAARQVPEEIALLLNRNGLEIGSIDKFIFHQGSKYMHQTIVSRLKIEPAKAPFGARDYGNTVSSSIPILLEQEIEEPGVHTVVICGFGAGLSSASGILFRENI